MARQTKKGMRAAGRNARTGSAPVSVDLEKVFRRVLSEARRGRRPTLAAVRSALQRTSVTWSKEGELLFPQDRTALLIEVDELIERHGVRADVLRLVAPLGLDRD